MTKNELKSTMGEVQYQRGLAIYQNDGVRETTPQAGGVCYVINETPRRIVWIREDAKVSKCSCDEYIETKTCSHIVAAQLAYMASGKADEYLARHARELGHLLLGQYEPISRETLLIIEPTIHIYAAEDKLPALSLRVGKNRTFVVRNIPNFVRSYKNKEPLDFCKGFEFQPQWMDFNEQGKALLQMLMEICAALEPAENEGFKLPDNRLLPIPAPLMARAIRLMSCLPFQINTTYGLFKVEGLVKEPLPIKLTLAPTGRDLSLTANFEGNIRPLDMDGEFVLLNGRIYQLPQQDRQALYPLLKSLQMGNTLFRFSSQQAGRAVSELLPQLMASLEVDISASLENRLIRVPLKAEIYLDKANSGIIARIKYIYGNVTIDPFAPMDDTTSELLLVRNAKAEREVIDVLSGYGFKVRLGEVYLSGQDEIYAFITGGVTRLNEVGEVYGSIDFKKLAPRKAALTGNAYVRGSSLMIDMLDSGEPLPPQDLLQLLAALRDKRKYFRMHDGSYIELEGLDEWSHLMGNLADTCTVSADGHLITDAHRAMYMGEMLTSVPEITVHESVLKATSLDAGPLDPCPISLRETLRGYQERGFEWLQMLYKLNLGGVLADDMGLGKTLQVIALMLWAAESLPDKVPSLVVAPTSLTYNWQAEIKRFAPSLRTVVMDGGRKKRQEVLAQLTTGDMVDVIITSYPLLRKDSELLGDVTFRFLVLDEAQNVKNAQSVGAVAVRSILAQSRFALTGTPMENHPGELWAIFDFVLPGYLLTYTQFMSRHGEGKDSQTLVKKIRPFLMRRLKKDVLPELPEKLEQRIMADMNPDQKRYYMASLQRLRRQVDDLLREKGIARGRVEVLAAITELRQLCCHPGLCVNDLSVSSGKLDLLMDILPAALEAGHRVLLFSQFTRMLEIIRKKLEQQGISYKYLDGKTPTMDRLKLVDEFNEGDGEVFLISLKAGGSGLNLTGADMVIHYDPWWNPAVEDQATDRAHRIGQTRSVQVFKLITHDTIEEQVWNLSQRKRALFDEMVVAGETLPAHITDQELRSLFDL